MSTEERIYKLYRKILAIKVARAIEIPTIVGEVFERSLSDLINTIDIILFKFNKILLQSFILTDMLKLSISEFNYANDAGNDSRLGTVAWVDTEEAIGEEDGYDANVTLGLDEYSYYLKLYNYTFNISSEATIDGIKVEARVRCSSGAIYETAAGVRIMKGGDPVGDDLGKDDYLPGTWTWQTYGGPSEKLGETWTPADINSSNFGFLYSIMSDQSGTNIAEVDCVRITVYYSIS